VISFGADVVLRVAAAPICAADAVVRETPGYPYSVQEACEVFVKSITV
jgi:hypothetical protein